MSIASETTPTTLPNPDFSRLVRQLQEGVNSVAENNGHPGKDFEHYVFETAMECAFGKDVRKWWNAHANY